MAIPTFESPDEVCAALREAIAAAIAGAEVRVQCGSPGHFEIQVTSKVFSGQPIVQQQQLVYGAIGHLMAGVDAPVHAIDRLRTSIV